MPKPRIELPRLNGASVPKEWQPMSLEIWTVPTSRSRCSRGAEAGLWTDFGPSDFQSVPNHL